MISSFGFVPTGVLKRHPIRANVTTEDLEALRSRLGKTMHQPDDEEATSADTSSDEAIMEIDEHTAAVQRAIETAQLAAEVPFQMEPTGDPELDEALKEMHFEKYDDADHVLDTAFLDRLVSSSTQVSPPTPSEDAETDSGSHDEDSEEESVEIDDGDLVFITTKTDDILSALEIWIYEEADDETEGNLLMHHDIALAHFPLCCAYLNAHLGAGSDSRHLVAVGSMECDIELYDLDVLDPIAPLTTLHATSKKKKKPSTITMDLNEIVCNVMASGSDDKHVRVWDIDKGIATSELKLHKSTVQCVKWNPQDAPILVSGGHDKKCAMVDVRNPDGNVLDWKLEADNECLVWCRHQGTCFLSSDEQGTVAMFDARNGARSDPLFSIAAHKDNTTVVDICPLNSSLFMTGSEDGKVKLWDLTVAEPLMVEKKAFGVGQILAGGFCRHAGHLVAVGGENGNVEVWDLRSSTKTSNYFPTTLPEETSLVTLMETRSLATLQRSAETVRAVW